MFADDAVIIKESRKTELAVKAMQKALDNLYEWTQAWGFKVLTGKTVAILFNKKKDEEIQHIATNCEKIQIPRCIL